MNEFLKLFTYLFMRYLLPLLGVCTVVFISCSSLEKAASKAGQEIEERIGNNNSGDDSTADAGVERANRTSNFVAGNQIIFQENFSSVQLGEMAKIFKSDGSGEVVTFPNVRGKWLLMNQSTTFKIDSLLNLPDNFTVEFDLITRSDEADDLNRIDFGFAYDNKIRINTKSIAEVTVHYYNQEIMIRSRDTDIYNEYDHALVGYANAIMHVAMQIEGERLKVYLDQDKVIDTKVFDSGVRKFFYFETNNLDNDAQIALGNFVIAK